MQVFARSGNSSLWGGRVALIKSRPCVLSFSLSVSHMDVVPRNPSFLCVPFCFFLPGLCLAVSHPFLISSFGPPAAAAGKVFLSSPPHFLLLHYQRLFFRSHIFPFHSSSITVDFCTCLFFPFFPLFTMEQL